MRVGRSIRPRYARRFRKYLNPVHYFRRGTNPSSYALTANITGLGGTGFIGAGVDSQLGYLVNNGDFLQLYDQYKIVKTTIYMKWSITTNDAVPADNILANPPVLKYHKDYDDATAPTHSQLQERATTKTLALRPNKVYRFTHKPATLRSIYQSALANAYAPQWNTFIDVGNPNVPHYGFKFGLNYEGNKSYGTVQLWQVMTIACKGQR